VRDSVRPIPQIGAVFKIDETFSVFGRYAEGFKMPTAEQLYTSLPGLGFNLIPNPDLRPEKARTIEAGLRGRFDRGWFSISAFNTRYVDFIQSFVSVNAIDITFQNLSQVRISGIEASGEYRPTENLTLSGALTYQYGVQKATPAAAIQPFDGAGPLRGTLGLRYALPQYNLEASVVGNFAGGVTRASTATLIKPGGWSTFDAFLTWKPTQMLTLRAGVINITDKRYVPSLAGGTTYTKTASAAVSQVNPFELQYAAGRSFRLSAQVDF
jgi:hemoglobin/transferrin/lactoferrin receptor protein